MPTGDVQHGGQGPHAVTGAGPPLRAPAAEVSVQRMAGGCRAHRGRSPGAWTFDLLETFLARHHLGMKHVYRAAAREADSAGADDESCRRLSAEPIYR